MAPRQVPHQTIQIQNETERFLIDLFDSLWERYRGRVGHAQRYEMLLAQQGANFLNDHVVFHTLASEKPVLGHFMISRIFEALGYRGVACYEVQGSPCSSIFFQHPNLQFPKLLVSQLKTWELSKEARSILQKSMKAHRPALSDAVLASLWNIERASQRERTMLIKILMRYFEELPWELPQRQHVLDLDLESPFAAWVLVNGYDVHHFTASVHAHAVITLDDIEKVQAEMLKAGIPMIKEVEGARGTRLRTTSTEACLVPVQLKDRSKIVEIPWTYASFEIVERPLQKNPMTGEMERFEGFLGG